MCLYRLIGLAPLRCYASKESAVFSIRRYRCWSRSVHEQIRDSPHYVPVRKALPKCASYLVQKSSCVNR